MKSIRFILLFLIASSFTTNPAKPLKLQYAFAVGDNYEMTQVSKQTIKQTIPGMGEMTIDVALEGVMNLKVVELTATGAKIETTYSKVKVSTKSPMGDVVMDSEGPADNMQNKMVKAMTMKPIFIFMNKRGNIEKVENTENLYSGLNELGLDEAGLAAAKQSMQQALGEGSIKGSIEMVLNSYPETALKVGDTWKNSIASASSFPMNSENVSTLSKLEGTTGNIDTDGTIATADKEKILPVNGMKAKADLTGRQMMKTVINVKTGWPTEVKTISEIKGIMTLLAGGQIPEDMPIPMEIAGESTYTIVKK
jgi:hypothetical protein